MNVSENDRGRRSDWVFLPSPPTPQEQYEFCYKVVQEYIDAFSDYANFK